VPITGSLVTAGAIETRRLPAIRAATAIARGPYSILRSARADLERWAQAAHVSTAGPVRVVYLQFGAESDLGLTTDFLVDRDADFVTEVQLPIA